MSPKQAATTTEGHNRACGVTVKDLEEGKRMGEILVKLFIRNEERRNEKLSNGITMNINRDG